MLQLSLHGTSPTASVLVCLQLYSASIQVGFSEHLQARCNEWQVQVVCNRDWQAPARVSHAWCLVLALLHVAVCTVKPVPASNGQQEQLGPSLACCLFSSFVELDLQMSIQAAWMMVLTHNAMTGADVHPSVLDFFQTFCQLVCER